MTKTKSKEGTKLTKREIELHKFLDKYRWRVENLTDYEIYLLQDFVNQLLH